MMVVILHNQKIGGLFLAYIFVLKAAELFIDNVFLDLAQCDIALEIGRTYICTYMFIYQYEILFSIWVFQKARSARVWSAIWCFSE